MHQNVPERDDLIASFTPSIHFDVHVTVHRVKFLIIKPTRCTNFSDLFLEWNSTCKVRVPQGGILTLRLKHHFTITSSTSTMWFSRSLLYVANHTVFKVNHMVEDQSPGSRPTTGSSRPILLTHPSFKHLLKPQNTVLFLLSCCTQLFYEPSLALCFPIMSLLLTPCLSV